MAGELQGELREKYREIQKRYERFLEGLDSRQVKMLEALLFLVRFSLLAVPFYLLIGSGWEAEGLRAFNAQLSASLLDILGLEASSSGSFVRVGAMAVDVTRDSTGWKSIVVFSALVLAAKRGWKSKLKGISVGGAFLAGVNLFRIVSMVYAVKVFRIDYELLHLFLWRWGLTAAVMVAWILWMRSTAPARRSLGRP